MKIFRVYGRPLPVSGETVTLPVDGHSIRARVPVSLAQAETQRVDAAVVEVVAVRQMELV
jgi:hypothetical protein